MKNLIFRCLICITFYVNEHNVAQEVTREDIAADAAFESLVEQACFYAIRS